MKLKEKNDDHEGALTAMENVLVWGDRVLLPIINKDRSAVSPGVFFCVILLDVDT